MIATIIKGGHEAAIKMWGVMGALTGVAFGSITSFYFTKDKFEEKISSISHENSQLASALNKAVENAEKVNDNIFGFKSVLEGKQDKDAMYKFPFAAKLAETLPADDKTLLIDRLEMDSKKLKQITDQIKIPAQTSNHEQKN
ncbi:hypothetical protein D3C78_1052350 [compost metagenome]